MTSENLHDPCGFINFRAERYFYCIECGEVPYYINDSGVCCSKCHDGMNANCRPISIFRGIRNYIKGIFR